ncbi:DEAD/DEAH box helicase [Candidatus Gracilibacteria bacterium]|nr:DEAD/DEAH box helicase [Candidatus Gracilibacteria bacterium]
MNSHFGHFRNKKRYSGGREEAHGNRQEGYGRRGGKSAHGGNGASEGRGGRDDYGRRNDHSGRDDYGKRNDHSGRDGSAEHGGFGQRRFRKPMQKSGRFAGTKININQLINKVNDESFIKPTEQVIQNQFDDFKIDPRIKNNIKRKGYLTPTPIQDQTIPLGLQGNDVIGLANTGTGKTAAFLIPLINKMLDNRANKVLILAPTRELAIQINDELWDFAKGLNLNSILCIGGSNIAVQARLLKHQFHFIIGTPGRIMDLIKRKLLVLDHFQNLVLDEADRMVDMGFINDIRFILGKLPVERQSFFFTATLDKKVEDLIRPFAHHPVKVSVKMRDTSANIEQDIVRVPKDNKAKMAVLVEMLARPDFEKVLVFCKTKHGAEKTAKMLKEVGIRSDSIHGNKTQSYRMKALQRFKKSEIQALIATDVAARGLDISCVSHVINYDVPANYDDYVHRIGRTGRADRKGVALTFVTK